MCHGFRDVANLAWKLELVERGGAPPGLMATYQTERDPHVRQVISAAIDAGRYICLLDPKAAEERDARMRSQARSATPQTAADLIPPIRAGVMASGTPGSGERFIQPSVAAGSGPVLLDDLHSGWRLFLADSAMAEAAKSLVAARLPGLPLTTLAADTLADGGALADWLRTRGAEAVIVRPDFYVFGGAVDGAGLEVLIGLLSEQLFGEKATRWEDVA